MVIGRSRFTGNPAIEKRTVKKVTSHTSQNVMLFQVGGRRIKQKRTATSTNLEVELKGVRSRRGNAHQKGMKGD